MVGGTITGVGKTVMAMVIMMEVGDIGVYRKWAITESYCRCSQVRADFQRQEFKGVGNIPERQQISVTGRMWKRPISCIRQTTPTKLEV